MVILAATDNGGGFDDVCKLGTSYPDIENKVELSSNLLFHNLGLGIFSEQYSLQHHFMHSAGVF